MDEAARLAHRVVEIPVYHHPDGTRTIGQPDPRHGIRLGRIASAHNRPNLRHRAAKSCDCLACLTGRPDYPCLIEDTQP